MSTVTPKVGSNNVASSPATTNPEIKTEMVQNSETKLSQVALRLGVSKEALQEANPQINPNKLQAGQEIKLPGDSTPETPASESQVNSGSYSKSAIQARMAEHNFGSVARQLQITTQASQSIGGVQQNVLNDQLREAASKNDLKKIEDLVKKGADVNSKDAEGKTALIHAAEAGSVQALETLAKVYKADVNAQDNSEQTALMKASITNKNDAVKSLLDLKAKVDIHDKSGATALLHAARQGNPDVLSTLLNKGHADPNIGDLNGRYPLMEVARRGDTESAKELIRKNADVNAQDNNKTTALMDAIQNGNPSLIRSLAKRSDPDLQDRQGNTALMLLLRRLQTVGAASVDSATLQSLIKRSKSLDLQDVNGNTALMEAGRMGDDEAMKALIAAGADVDLQDRNGRTVLMDVIDNNRFNSPGSQFPAIDTLLAKANLDVQDNAGRTALMLSASRDDDNMVKALHLKGANLDIADRDGKTALMHAAQNGNKWVVKALLDKSWQNEDWMAVKRPTRKADPFLKDNTSSNALRLAEQELHRDLINQKNKKPALEPQKRAAYQEIVDYLKKEMDLL